MWTCRSENDKIFASVMKNLGRAKKMRKNTMNVTMHVHFNIYYLLFIIYYLLLLSAANEFQRTTILRNQPQRYALVIIFVLRRLRQRVTH